MIRKRQETLSRNTIKLSFVFITALTGQHIYAADVAIPEEYGSTGGNSLAFGGSVASAMGGASAVRSNPSLIALEKEYAVNAAYHWPTAGRDYYQVGVVDGKTSAVAAGFSYTGALDNYQGIASPNPSETSDAKGSGDISKDSPIVRRAAIAFAMPIGKIYTGVQGGYVEARNPAETLFEDGSTRVKAFTLGFGIAAHFSQAFRIGLSAENLANRKVQFAAPTYYRAASSYFFGSTASVHMDYRRREAITVYEGRAPSLTLSDDGSAPSTVVLAENFANISTSVKVYDLLRLIAAAGQTKSQNLSATQVAGGLSLINEKFNFSYQVLRPNVAEESVHHALSLGIEMAM
jgi:hypothetical protein